MISHIFLGWTSVNLSCFYFDGIPWVNWPTTTDDFHPPFSSYPTRWHLPTCELSYLKSSGAWCTRMYHQANSEMCQFRVTCASLLQTWVPFANGCPTLAGFEFHGVAGEFSESAGYRWADGQLCAADQWLGPGGSGVWDVETEVRMDERINIIWYMWIILLVYIYIYRYIYICIHIYIYIHMFIYI